MLWFLLLAFLLLWILRFGFAVGGITVPIMMLALACVFAARLKRNEPPGTEGTKL